MKLIVIRNTEAPSNVKYIVGGRSDEELTSKGIKQAEKLKEELKEYDYDVIISSPVRRAVQTAEIINYKNLEIKKDERITERESGSLLLKDRNLVDKTKWNSLTELKTDDGAETLLALIKRTEDFLKEARKKYEDKTIVIITHNSISRAIWMIYNKENNLEEINAYYQNSETIQVYDNC